MTAALFSLLVATSPTDWSRPGTYPVSVVNETWMDRTRSREIPARIYRPASDARDCPVIVFSHGLGGNVEAGEAWGRQWASWGFVSVHIQHHGSDTDVIRSGSGPILQRFKTAISPQQLINRATDAKFVYDEIGRRCKSHDPAFAGALSNDIGFSGHSFGAQTTLAVAGQVFPTGASMADPRYRAFEAFSPSAMRLDNLDRQFGAITRPFMSLTGSQDRTNITPTVTPENRTLPFQHMAPGNKYLVWLNTANHMSFSGQTTRRLVRTLLTPALGRDSVPPNDAHIARVVKASTTAFWCAYLEPRTTLGREAAAWLKSSGPTGLLDPSDRWESR